MSRKTAKWEKISAARQLLGLGNAANLEEIREAYHRQAKQHHPDTTPLPPGTAPPVAMHHLTEAYQVLVDYCHTYRIPLAPEENDQDDGDEDWWMKRFGQDPLWGKIRD
jgi:hypothetical protein